MTRPVVDLELDCRGAVCPAPILELGRRLTEVPVGGVIAVVSDDPAAAIDVPAWCRLRGQDFVGTDVADDGVPVQLVRRLS